MPKKPTTIGQRLLAARQRRKLTQDQLAELSGVTQTAISDIERSGRDPLASTIAKLASALSVTTDSLLGIRSRCTSINQREWLLARKTDSEG